jgi:rSAM/selenodomain-associated transferase 1
LTRFDAARGADLLVVMAREPVPGAVKSRLARTVGADAACALYRAFLADLAAQFGSGPWELVWAVTPAGADLSALIGTDRRQIAQRGGDLAARMRDCFTQLFDAGAARVVMIGADAPHLQEATVRAAFAALGEDDATLLPTRDGGYCLVGLRRPHDIFSGIPMGGPTVFARTCARLDALGLRRRELPMSFDVDEVEDVVALAALIASGSVTLPHTAAVLRDWQRAGVLPQPRGR